MNYVTGKTIKELREKNGYTQKQLAILFISYVTSNRTELVKLYPEQNAECRFAVRGHGKIYAYCNKHGLYVLRV